MGAKVCFVLVTLLLSHVLIPIEVAAREMLQEHQITEEAKSHIDAHRVSYKPLKPVRAPKGMPPYARPATPYYPPNGRPYTPPRIPYNPPPPPLPKGSPYPPPGRPCQGRYGCRGPPGP